MKNNTTKPTPARISQWDDQDRVLYNCPRCGTSFGIYCQDEKFCHSCGQAIEWNGVCIRVNSHIKNRYHNELNIERRKVILEWIDRANKTFEAYYPFDLCDFTPEAAEQFDDTIRKMTKK